MRTVIFSGTAIAAQRYGVGQPGSYWEFSEGSDSIRLLTAEAQELAKHIDQSAEKVSDQLSMNLQCATMEGESILLRLSGGAAKAISGAIHASK